MMLRSLMVVCLLGGCGDSARPIETDAGSDLNRHLDAGGPDSAPDGSEGLDTVVVSGDAGTEVDAGDSGDDASVDDAGLDGSDASAPDAAIADVTPSEDSGSTVDAMSFECPVGRWAGGRGAATSGLFTCFASDGRVGFSDSLGPIAASTRLWWDSAGNIMSARTGGSVGQWSCDDEMLIVDITPPCDGDCRASYGRDDTVPCFF